MKITVLYGTETGNCRAIANKVARKGEKNGVEMEVIDLANYSVEQLAAVENPVLIVISTWGDGTPPPNCVTFCNALSESTEALSRLRYTVLALGDRVYPLYCVCGKQVDEKLSELGATRLMDRTNLGTDFMVTFSGWSKQFWKTMAKVFGVAA